MIPAIRERRTSALIETTPFLRALSLAEGLKIRPINFHPVGEIYWIVSKAPCKHEKLGSIGLKTALEALLRSKV